MPIDPPVKPVIAGIAGASLRPDEAALFRHFPPAGIILFARNIETPVQLGRLMEQLRRVLPRDAVRMVDQEGGRVARLRPPHWRAHPPGAALKTVRRAWLTGVLIGLDCARAGFNCAAAPVLDLSIPGAHDVIGDRALGTDPEDIARLGRAFAAGLMAAGIQPVGKHAPGHGRAEADSHLALPVVMGNDLDADILPFARNADLPWLMTAHIVYPTLDPDRPATLSPTIIRGIIRGRIGFQGVLVTDDLAMKALEGAPADLACEALAAGCDIALYCSGDFALTEALLAQAPHITDITRARLTWAREKAQGRRIDLNEEALARERDRALS